MSNLYVCLFGALLSYNLISNIKLVIAETWGRGVKIYHTLPYPYSPCFLFFTDLQKFYFSISWKNKISSAYSYFHVFNQCVIIYGKKGFIFLRLILQGTAENNLGPDRLAGLKALNLNYYRQLTLLLHELCLEVLTVHVSELRLFWAKAFPLLSTHTINVAHLIKQQYKFKLLFFGPSIEPITFPAPSRYATCHVTDAGIC